ncbi:Uncharacterised protein [Mycobacteroides abscessus subsp. bolletii]|uniref:hypothetical protein n=1 Tax=Mycobacteroides abscessus TaxID=36809 RepID=UPI0009A63C61|nr:hypothetical protein [Mycobacteroides abscessus]SKR94460.1 Uncharacterised protein [Mycobacteroides abscessus subsp. bolletii]SKS03142.1 Uncharacterised protein [Mycobacteroides abscessus subsp. bolletii]DAZ90096.1 TPA_asm: hypothetical protein PROPHIFVLQ01-1_9 [Mycobacterium phage prophiFVLQ01-1]
MREYPVGTMAFTICPDNDNHTVFGLRAEDGWYLVQVTEESTLKITREPSTDEDILGDLDMTWVVCRDPSMTIIGPEKQRPDEFPSGSIIFSRMPDEPFAIVAGVKTLGGWEFARINPDGKFEAMAFIHHLLTHHLGMKVGLPEDENVFGSDDIDQRYVIGGDWTIVHVPTVVATPISKAVEN